MARKTTQEQIDAAIKDRDESQKRLDKLLAEQKEKDKKARNHRLCKRGGQIEKLFPALAEMDDKQFEMFVDKTLLTGHAERIINQIIPPPPAEPKDGASAAQNAATTAPQTHGIAGSNLTP